jgi:hypothetical protein
LNSVAAADREPSTAADTDAEGATNLETTLSFGRFQGEGNAEHQQDGGRPIK